MEKFITKHVDSSVWIGAFIPDSRDKTEGIHKECRLFLDNIMTNERNTRLRISFTAMGEILKKHLWKPTDSDRECGIEAMKDYITRAGPRVDVYSPRLLGAPEFLSVAISNLRNCCDDMLKANADATILAYAMVDREASTLITLDNHLLFCNNVRSAVSEFRREYNLPKLGIRPVS